MKKLVMLGIGVSGILSAAVLAEGPSLFYALSNITSGQQASPAMSEPSLAAIEGGVSVPFLPSGLVSIPFPIDLSELPACNKCNILNVQPSNVCKDPPCGPQNTLLNIIQNL